MNNFNNKNLQVYRSSAGSGKTFTLVKEYLKLCLNQDYPRVFTSILAITFTNKATYEMKERVLSELKGIAEGVESNKVLKTLLLDDLKISSGEIQQRSHKVLTEILHSYADLNISTIDKFSHKLIRTFAKDLNLSLNFQVQLNEDEILERSIDQLIDLIGSNKETTDLLLNYSIQKLDDEKSWKIEDDLFSFSKNLITESGYFYLTELRKVKEKAFLEIKGAYLDSNLKVEQNIKNIGREAINLIDENQIEYQSFAGQSKITDHFKRLLKFDINDLDVRPTLLKNIEKQSWYSSKCSSEQKLKIDLIINDLLKLFNKSVEIMEEEMPHYFSRFELLKNINNLALLRKIEKQISEYKKQESTIGISDFNRLIAEVVLYEPMPFIYERIGEYFQYFMIDEFQDTSVLQFNNLLPLIEDSLSKGNRNLIVGDAKQAIYRFRGGEVEQFSEMPNYVSQITKDNTVVNDRVTSFKNEFKSIPLKINYRSSKTLVDFNNDFFGFVKEQEERTLKQKRIFENHSQEIKINEVGYTSIFFSQCNNKEDLISESNSKVLNYIERCQKDGFKLSDIAILCRRKKDTSSIAEYLVRNNIEIISSEALLLKESNEVKFMIALGKYICNQNDIQAKKIIIEFLNLSKSNVLLDEAFNNYLKSESKFDNVFADHQINFELNKLNQLSALDLFENLIRLFSLNKKYDLYLQNFQDMVFEFSSNEDTSLEKFLDWWEINENKITIDSPENTEAISIMTIHKSKGLEFPVVIYPYASQKVEHSSPFKKTYLWSETISGSSNEVGYGLVEFSKYLKKSSLSRYYDEELEKKEIDLINDTYVAFTRAKTRMYILTEASKKSELLSLPQLLNSYCLANGFDLDKEVVFGEERVTRIFSNRTKEQPLNYISNSWASSLKISNQAEKNWITTNELSPQDYGILLHDILSKVKFHNDVAGVINQFVLKGFLSNNEAYFLVKKINSILAIEEIKPLFEEGLEVRNEFSLLSVNGKTLRPDRVVFLKEETIVIDYKTGEENDSYLSQLGLYMDTVSKLTNKPTRGILLYTELEKIKKIA